MAWLGLIVGVVLGALIGKVAGALALGFIGWLVGFIIQAATKPKEPVGASHSVVARPPDASVLNRLAAIERRLSAIEERLGLGPFAAKGATPVVATPREETPAEPITAPGPAVSGSLDLSVADMSRSGEWGVA